MTNNYTLGGMMADGAIAPGDTVFFAVEQKNRTEIAVYQGQQKIATLAGAQTDNGIFAGYPSITVGPDGWCVAYQKGFLLCVSTAAGHDRIFTNDRIGQPACIEWVGHRYVVAIASRLQKVVLELDQPLNELTRTATPWGNDRYAKLIKPDGTVVWDKSIPYGEYPSRDGSIVCKEANQTDVYFTADRTKPAYQLPAGFEPKPYRKSTGALVVVQRGGKVYEVAAAPFLYPIDPPVDPPPPPPPPPPPDPGAVTDANLIEVSQKLEAIYRDTLHRSTQNTYVDELGASRWRIDYLTARQRGEDHAQALETMRRAIHAAAGIP